jgi:hypothetical protein
MAKPDIVTSRFLPLAGANHYRFQPWFCQGACIMSLEKQVTVIRHDNGWHYRFLKERLDYDY